MEKKEKKIIYLFFFFIYCKAVKAAFKYSKYTNTRLEMNFEDDTRLKIRAFNQSRGKKKELRA